MDMKVWEEEEGLEKTEQQNNKNRTVFGGEETQPKLEDSLQSPRINL